MEAIDWTEGAAAAGLAPQGVSAFLKGVTPLSAEERREIVEQALLLMEEVYVHLPLKRAMHAVDPVQRLRVLRHRVDLISERAFHEEMISTFASVRDLHTNYILPAPYNASMAYVPFELRELWKGDTAFHIVSGVAQGLTHPTFKPGVRITHLNGVPVARAIEIVARQHAGSNAEANHARGLERVTFRPLMMSLPPDEEWMDVRYQAADGSAQEIRLPWMVHTRAPAPPSASAPAQARKARFAQGVDLQALAVQDLKKRIFSSERVQIEASVARFLRGAEGPEPDFTKVSKMPEVFAFGVKKAGGADRAYVRIFTFDVDDDAAFVAEFVRIVALLPQDGLILDVRGNGGGNIMAGEKLLQTMSAIPIEPERLQFITTPRMVSLVKGVPDWFGKWARSMEQAVITGATYSQALPFEDAAAYNHVGRKYPGKVVLLTDARCYSTTDIFSAGFQDHGIGPVLGNDNCTGAGGANVFKWEDIKELFDSFAPGNPFRALPKGAAMRVAVRRTTRVRELAGEPLEDLGVTPDHLHRPTLNDILEDDRDLFERAAALLVS